MSGPCLEGLTAPRTAVNLYHGRPGTFACSSVCRDGVSSSNGLTWTDWIYLVTFLEFIVMPSSGCRRKMIILSSFSVHALALINTWLQVLAEGIVELLEVDLVLSIFALVSCPPLWV
jgi:hypothetical protein